MRPIFIQQSTALKYRTQSDADSQNIIFSQISKLSFRHRKNGRNIKFSQLSKLDLRRLKEVISIFENNLYTVRNTWLSLKQQGYTTSNGYELTYKDVYNGIAAMIKKHSICEWLNYDYYCYTLITLEGYYWLREVYFSKGISLINADVKFFESIIEDYKYACNNYNIKYYIKPFIADDMTFSELAQLLNRRKQTVQKAYYKLPSAQKNNSYYLHGKKYIVSSVCEDLCKAYFPQYYLKYLEQIYLTLKNKLSEKGIEVYV